MFKLANLFTTVLECATDNPEVTRSIPKTRERRNQNSHMFLFNSLHRSERSSEDTQEPLDRIPCVR